MGHLIRKPIVEIISNGRILNQADWHEEERLLAGNPELIRRIIRAINIARYGDDDSSDSSDSVDHDSLYATFRQRSNSINSRDSEDDVVVFEESLDDLPTGEHRELVVTVNMNRPNEPTLTIRVIERDSDEQRVRREPNDGSSSQQAYHVTTHEATTSRGTRYQSRSAVLTVQNIIYDDLYMYMPESDEQRVPINYSQGYSGLPPHNSILGSLLSNNNNIAALETEVVTLPIVEHTNHPEDI